MFLSTLDPSRVSTVVQKSRFCSSYDSREVPHLRERERERACSPTPVLAKCYGTLLSCIMRVEPGRGTVQAGGYSDLSAGLLA